MSIGKMKKLKKILSAENTLAINTGSTVVQPPFGNCGM